MDYKVIEEQGKVIVEGIKDFELAHIFECGQCFRWNREEDGSYTGVAMGKVMNILKEGDSLIFDNTSIDDFYNIWVSYFDLERDYGVLKRRLGERDPILKKAIEHGEGIRILNQDEWEILISFIISSNRGIGLIKKSIEALCERYGEYIGEYRGRKYYDFPEAKVLINKSVEEIRKSHTGYRAKYIVDAAAVVGEEQIRLYNVKNISTAEGRKTLMRIMGVGPKVADCILLFSMEKYDAFPIDVWVKRVMEYFYFEKETGFKEIQGFAKELFKEDTGFAQQYLFYYARELGIGKKGK